MVKFKKEMVVYTINISPRPEKAGITLAIVANPKE
jgi:hypothetical protein